MSTYAALFRGINLGSRKRVKMADLQALFTDLGYEGVVTYLQSGNLVFRASQGRAQVLTEIESSFARRFAFPVTVMVRSRSELDRTVGGNPFLEAGGAPEALHVTFLADKPVAARVRSIDEEIGGADRFRVLGREVFLHCPNGYGRSKLDNAFWESRLGVAATTRNWRTVTSVLELARA